LDYVDWQNHVLGFGRFGIGFSVGLCRDFKLGAWFVFRLGGYAFGMYLMRESAGDGLPDFMRFLSWTELPWYWVGTEHFAWAMILVLSVPALVAFIFGFFAFAPKSRVCISQLLPKP
jgi:ABC-type branched-subunit amino acid transport system permease subunit